jgi:DNA polymerase-3 subunit gamma/tau
MFGEEDLTRHLQIMLRTHSELGFKQEQRFHLELGLLKMAHAQKLIPIEQLLTDVGVAAVASAQRPAARPSIVGGALSSEVRRAEAAPAARPNSVSPFAADSARKGTPRQEASFDTAPATGPRIVAGASAPEPVIMGSAARVLEPEPEPIPNRRDKAEGGYLSAGATVPEMQPEALLPQPQVQPSVMSAAQDPIEKLQAAVLQALTDGNQRILVSMLADGEWSVLGNEVVIKVTESQTVVDMSLGPDARRLAIASASGVLGRAMKLRVVPGASVAPQENKRNGAAARPSGPGGRGRAEEDPVVRRMQEKFGAQIRTVIDYRDKR